MRSVILFAFLVLTFAPARRVAVVAAPGPEGGQGEKPQPKKKAGRPGEVNTPAAKGERIKDQLKPGDPAPDFTLSDPKGTRKLTLSSFRDKRPVVLVFGSYT